MEQRDGQTRLPLDRRASSLVSCRKICCSRLSKARRIETASRLFGELAGAIQFAGDKLSCEPLSAMLLAV
jgi:hypothetical protein